MGNIRRAQLLAEAVTVCCPYCGEPQPNRDGSEMWTREDFQRLATAGQERKVCTSCDETMHVGADSRAQFV